MTVIVLALVLGGAIGVLRHGSLSGLRYLRVRAWPLAVGAALAESLLGFLPAPGRLPLVLVSCVAVMVWCVLNLGIASILPGMALLSAGVLINSGVIAANGAMPVSRWALAQAGFSSSLNLRGTFPYKHVPITHATSMPFLGDVLPARVLHTVLSAGDVVMLAGAFLIAMGATRVAIPTGPDTKERDAGASAVRRVAGGPQVSACDEVVSDNFEPLLPALKGAVAIYDVGTAKHSARVGEASAVMAQQLGLGPEEVESVSWAGLLHDIGKLGVPVEVLRKKGALTSAEWDEVRRHPTIGSDLVLAISRELAPVAEAILAHHERWDGTGYPNGMAGEEIPLIGRVVGLYDAFDAMTHRRAYRTGWASPAEALAELGRGAGRQFDPRLVKTFAELHSRGLMPSAELGLLSQRATRARR